jgi:hypothetical protein
MAPDDDIWDMYPGALPSPVADRDSLAGRLRTCSALERVWILALLGRGTESVHEEQTLLAGSTNRLYPLLVLARVFQSHTGGRKPPACTKKPFAKISWTESRATT